jgi:hypothetical protein
LSSIALVFGHSPEESFTPATIPGYFDSNRSMSGRVIATWATGGMWYR